MRFPRKKYRNQPTEINGERFDSKLEARICEMLRTIHGERNVIRQISIPIGAARVRPDFLIIHERFEDGTFRAELADAKGVETQAWKAKANHLQDKHGINIRTIKK